ncbi:MAG TPA: flagellar hook-length control protein FliK [Rhizomicrobium sp.]
MFAVLLEKLNPSVKQGKLAVAHDATDNKAAVTTPTQSTDNPNSDLAAALAALQNITPQTTAPVTPNTGTQEVGDVLSKDGKPLADLKTVDPKELHAAQQPAQPVKPGAPTLPVMPAQGDEEDGAETATPKDAAAAKASLQDVAQTAVTAAQHMTRPATPAQTTQAEALPVKQDARQDQQQSNADSGSSQDKSSSRDQQQTQTMQAAPQTQSAPPATHAAAAQPAMHAQAAPQADVKVQQPVTVTGIGATAPTQAAQTTQPTATATVHVAQASTAQPDVAALAVSIAAKSQAGSKHFDIRLDPPELGRIEVHLSVDDSGKAQAHLSADKPQTLDLLQRDQSTLTKQLKDSGIDLGQSGLSFSLRGQDREGGNAAKAFPRGRALAVSAVADATPSSINTIASDSARLDIRV